MLFQVDTLTSIADRVGGSFYLSEHKSRTVAIGPTQIIPQLFFYDCYWSVAAALVEADQLAGELIGSDWFV